MAWWAADQAKYFPRLRQDKVKYYFDKIMRLKKILNTGTPCYILYYPKPKIWWSEILNLIKRGPSENARLLNMIRCYAALFSLQPSLTASTRPGLAWYSGFCKWVTSYLSSDGEEGWTWLRPIWTWWNIRGKIYMERVDLSRVLFIYLDNWLQAEQAHVVCLHREISPQSEHKSSAEKGNKNFENKRPNCNLLGKCV